MMQQDPPTDELNKRDLLKECLKSGPTSGMGSLALLALLLAADSEHVFVDHDKLVLVSAGLVLLLNIVRLLMLRHFLAQMPSVEDKSERSFAWWPRVTALYGVVVLGVSISWVALILRECVFHGINNEKTLLALITLAGITASGSSSLAPVAWINFAFIGISLLVPAIFFARLEPHSYFLSAVSLVYAGVLAVNAKNLREYLLQMSKQKNKIVRDSALLRSVFDAVPGYVSLLGKDLKYRLLNRKLVAQLGMSEQNWIGVELGSHDGASPFSASMRNFMHSDTATMMQEKILIKVGGHERRWHLLSASKVPESGDVVCISIDIHNEVKLNEENALQRAQMANSSKMAALGEMAAGIAHEINNPLAIIIGKASQLRDKILSDRFNEQQAIIDVGHIEATSERIARIVKGLRTFARNGEGDAMLPVALSSIVTNALALCTERFKFHGVQLKIQSVPDMTISCREVQICQVLVNLLSNAFDAVVEQPNKWVSVDFRRDKGSLEIVVKDGGPRISDEVAEKIMQPFFTTKEVGKGTGLGLSISQGIIADHKGKLFLDREAPNTSFVIRLPVLNQPAS